MAEPSDREGTAVIKSAVQSNRSHSGGKRPGQLGGQHQQLGDHLIQSSALTASEGLCGQQTHCGRWESFVFDYLQDINKKSS